MLNEPRTSWDRDELLRAIRQVRTRWRVKVALRGTAVVAGAGLAAFLLSAYGLEAFRFSPAAVVGFRIGAYAAALGLVAWFLVRPLLRRVTDLQVALYIEEHEAELEAAIVSAIDADAPGTRATQHPSPALVAKLVESAVEKCRAIDFGRSLERPTYRRSTAAIAALALATTALMLLGPAYLRHAAMALLFPAESLEAASPYHIEVEPGQATVARGSDVTVNARLSGFTAEEADLYTRRSPNAPFERLPLARSGEAASFEGIVLDLQGATDYFVQAAGVRSPVYTLTAADLPYVERLEIELRFPAYSGLEPRTVERGGDLAVLAGTTVKLRAIPTMPTKAGQVLRDEAEKVPLAVEADGSLTGSFTVTRNGFYRIDLESAAGAMVAASPQYTIDVLADQPPSVSFSKPGRDVRPTSVEEVFAEARADDDFGVGRLDLVYSVNGGPEKTERLFASGGSPRKEVTAGHTFFLEEMNLKPGDVVSYYAKATDNDAVGGAKSVSSDLYFLQIRPFRKDYKPAESQAGGGQGAGGQGGGGALSEEQRQIVTATFNVVRDRATVAADKYKENVVFLTLAQGQLRERVDALVQQMQTRLADADPEMQQIAGMLGKAVEEMKGAETELQKQRAKEALSPEQRALAELQQAEEAYRDVRVSLNNDPSGGGGGGQGARAEDLADLFQLEMDKLRSQYETERRSQQQAADNQIDEMAERLKELARRQEQEAERQRRMAGERASASGGAGGARQRQLADETEEAARRLERLSRENNRPDLAEAAKRLQEAADAMRRAAASGDASAMAEAQSALERLQQAGQQLAQEQGNRLARNLQDAIRRVQQLSAEQKDIGNEVRQVGQAGAVQGDELERLIKRKDAQAGEVADLERQLDRTAADSRREEPEASRRTQEAADGIRNDKLKEKIRYSKAVIQGRTGDDVAAFEGMIQSDLGTLEQKLRDAAGAIGQRAENPLDKALGRTRDLVRGVESLEQRTRDSAQGQQGQQDQQGPKGRQGQQQAQAQGGGQRGGDAAPRAGVEAGAPPTSAGGADRRPGRISPDEARQFRREARERGAEAQELRRNLQGLGVDPRDLDQIIRGLRDLENPAAYADPQGLAELQAGLVEGIKRFEYGLMRQLRGAAGNELFLSGSEPVPPGYRKLIEEYYKELAKKRKQ